MDLDGLLFETNALLKSAGEDFWGAKAAHAQTLKGRKRTEYILTWYGGMGSFNDLVLCRVNGHTVPDAELDATNEKLAALRSSLWDAVNRDMRD